MQPEAARSDDPLTNPLDWPWARSAPPVLSSESTHWRGALVRAWRGTSPVMVQPPLDHHYVVMHLGGAKRVTRRCDGPALSAIAETGSLTLVPAGAANVWRTEGPIAFAHLYVDPRRLDSVCDDVGGGVSGAGGLIERVGVRDPFLEPLFGRLLGLLRDEPDCDALLLDTLFEHFLLELSQRHMPASRARRRAKVTLSPHRLKRVLDFIESNLGHDVALSDLAEVSGTSPSHFSRAFHASTGRSPYRYLLLRRIDYARVLLLSQPASVEWVAVACGFHSRRHFSSIFRSVVGVGPRQYGALHRGTAVQRGDGLCRLGA